MLKRVTTTLALLLAVGSLSAQINFQQVAPTVLYDMAKSESKLVFMDLYASWCPPCKMMERDVFSRKDVGDFVNESFISVKYNIDEATGKEFAERYGVSSIPTYLIFDGDGKLLGRATGAMSSETFIFRLFEFLSQGEESGKR